MQQNISCFYNKTLKIKTQVSRNNMMQEKQNLDSAIMIWIPKSLYAILVINFTLNIDHQFYKTYVYAIKNKFSISTQKLNVNNKWKINPLQLLSYPKTF